MREFSRVAKLVKTRRLAKKMSQSAMSKKMGFKNGQFVSNIERGLCSVPTKKISLACDVLGLSKKILVDAMVTDYHNTLLNFSGE